MTSFPKAKATKSIQSHNALPANITIPEALRLYQNLRTDIFNALDFPPGWRAHPIKDQTHCTWRVCDDDIVCVSEDGVADSLLGEADMLSCDDELIADGILRRPEFTLVFTGDDDEAEVVMIFANNKEVK